MKFITNAQLKRAAVILIEKGSMTLDAREVFLKSVDAQYRELGMTGQIAVVEYLPGTSIPDVLTETKLKQLLQECKDRKG